MTTNIDCGCRIENTGMKEIGTHKPVLIIRHCRLHNCAADLRSTLEELMGLLGGEGRDDGIGATTWHLAQELLNRSAGKLKCCACDEWCTDENPAYNFDDGDEDFSLKCTDHFGLVHMVGYPSECFDDNGGAVLCVRCINQVRE